MISMGITKKRAAIVLLCVYSIVITVSLIQVKHVNNMLLDTNDEFMDNYEQLSEDYSNLSDKYNAKLEEEYENGLDEAE
jgi:cell division protein FtsL